MGRKSTEKTRIVNPEIKQVWAKKLSALYLKEGIEKYTMDEVAAHLEVSKATLYKYYSSRWEILEDVVKAKLQELAVFEVHLLDKKIPYKERYFNAIKASSMSMAGISNQFLMEVKKHNPELSKSIKEFQDYVLRLAVEFYKQGIEEGILRNIDPNLLAATDRMFIRAVSDPSFLIENKLDLKTAFEGYFLMKSQGIFNN